MNATLFVILIGLVGLAALTSYFIELETKGNSHKIFMILLGVFLVEATLAGHASNTPFGILRPQVGGQDFRPPDIVIVAALAARLISGAKRRFAMEQLLLMVFLLWYASELFPGLANGARTQQALFQGKTVFYVIGGTIIASGANLRRLADVAGKWGERLVGVVLLATLFQILNVRIQVNTPIQRLHRLGQLGNDSITLYTAIGLIVLAVECHRPEPRLRVAAAGVALVLAPLAGQQRASYLVVAVVAVAIAALATTARSFSTRLTVTPVQILLGGAAIVALGAAAFILNSGESVVTTRVDDAFGGQAEINSALARVDLAEQAISRIQERPIMGWGLGATVVRTAITTGETADAAAHNVLLDVTMRAGLVGLILFLVALVGIVRRGLMRWRDEPDNMVAGLQIGAILAITGFLAKAMVEPALDKYRLTLMVSMAFGLILADAGTSASDEPDARAAGPAERSPTRP